MDVGDLVGGRTPEGAGIDPDRDFVRWLKVLVGRNCESVAVSAQLFSINAEEFRS